MTPEEALTYIGFSHFRNRQKEIIDQITSSQLDYIVTLPTGYGKSLIYSVPAVMSSRPCLVVSPLVSLIYDQCEKLNRVNKVAFNISSSCMQDVSDEDTAFSDEQLQGSDPMIIFTTPEKLATLTFQQKLKHLHAQRPFSYFVLDEAHLVEQGLAFRPDFLKLYSMREMASSVPILCFSATCNGFSQNLLKRTLLLRKAKLIVETERRDNMHLHVHYSSKKTKMCPCKSSRCSWKNGCMEVHEDASKIIQASANGETLIVINSRKDCEKLFSDIARLFPLKRVEMYHGQLEDEKRKEVQHAFVSGKVDCLVATWASFGTGVDFPLLNNVLIYGIPSSFDTFVQTIGRGGRNGQEFFVHVYVKEADIARQRAIIKTETEKQSLPCYYRENLQKSFACMVSLIQCANSSRGCLSQWIQGLLYEQGQKLTVKFSDLHKIKAVNRKVATTDRARWDPVQKCWFLNANSFDPRYEVFGAVPPSRRSGCGKCSVCIHKRI